MAVHTELAKGRWQEMSLAEQLGNVGSEFERALSWKKKNHPVHFQNAFDRTLELTDLTLMDPRWRGYRLREIARMRESMCEILIASSEEPAPALGLQKYFLAFAILARKGK